eukprot:symbB.v1.2.034617.t1/scaffold4500.1/size38868/4
MGAAANRTTRSATSRSSRSSKADEQGSQNSVEASQPLLMDAAVSKAVDLAAKLRREAEEAAKKRRDRRKEGLEDNADAEMQGRSWFFSLCGCMDVSKPGSI